MNALIVVDVQNDFLPGGTLAVSNGDQIISVINQIMPSFDLVVATKDWHPSGHQSFASNHPGKKIGEVIDLHGIQQILWPDHCVQGSQGADFASELDTTRIHKIIYKGTDETIDSYSGFFDNGKKLETGLASFLKINGVKHLSIVGLATDYCVKFTAMDAYELGFHTTVIQNAVKAVNLNPNDEHEALCLMQKSGILIKESDEFTN